MVSARLNTLLRIPDRLQDSPAIVNIMGIEVFLLADFRQQNTNLVGDVGDGVIGGGLAPVGELGRDGEAFFAS